MIRGINNAYKKTSWLYTIQGQFLNRLIFTAQFYETRLNNFLSFYRDSKRTF
jgi:hypothetical protein